MGDVISRVGISVQNALKQEEETWIMFWQQKTENYLNTASTIVVQVMNSDINLPFWLEERD